MTNYEKIKAILTNDESLLTKCRALSGTFFTFTDSNSLVRMPIKDAFQWIESESSIEWLNEIYED